MSHAEKSSEERFVAVDVQVAELRGQVTQVVDAVDDLREDIAATNRTVQVFVKGVGDKLDSLSSQISSHGRLDIKALLAAIGLSIALGGGIGGLLMSHSKETVVNATNIRSLETRLNERLAAEARYQEAVTGFLRESIETHRQQTEARP